MSGKFLDAMAIRLEQEEYDNTPGIKLEYNGRISKSDLYIMFKSYSTQKINLKLNFLKKELEETRIEIDHWKKRASDIKYYESFLKQTKRNKQKEKQDKAKQLLIEDERANISESDDKQRYNEITTEFLDALTKELNEYSYAGKNYHIEKLAHYSKKKFIDICLRNNITLKLLVAFQYRFVNKLSVATIARLENVSEATIRTRLNKLRKAFNHPMILRKFFKRKETENNEQ